MLQRIQTIYLLAVTALMTILCFTPLATYAADGVEGAFVAFDFCPPVFEYTWLSNTNILILSFTF